MSDKIDLSGVFEGVKPTAENKLERLVVQIHVEEPIKEDDVPRKILFNVNGGEILRYVHLGSLPQEVVDVINRLPNTFGFSKHELLKSVDKLRESVLELPSPPHKFNVGDKVRIIQDELGIMVNEDLIGKPGVVREVDPMSESCCKYTVDLGYREIKLLEEMLEMIDE